MIIYELVTFDPSLRASLAKGLGKFPNSLYTRDGSHSPLYRAADAFWARSPRDGSHSPSTARPTPSGRGRLWEESRRDV